MSKKNNLLTKNIPPEIKNLWDDTEFLTYGAAIAGVIVLIVGGLLLQKIYGRNPPEIAYLCYGVLINLFLILGSLVGVVRHEIPRPGLSSIKGFWAVFPSAIILIITIIVELLLLYMIVTRLFH